MPNYFRSFVIGTSWLVILNFLLAVGNADPHKVNFDYKKYSLVAPLYFGVMNAISLYIGNRLGLSLHKRLLLISVISAIFIPSIAYRLQTYNFNREEWIRYFFRVAIRHLLTFNIIIYLLEISV